MQPPIPDPVFLNVEYLFFLGAKFVSYLFSAHFLELIRIVVSVLIILLVAVVGYLWLRLYEIKLADDRKRSTAEAPHAHPGTELSLTADVENLTASPSDARIRRNETWESIRAKLLSDNPSDWRLAIIEGDIYMDRLLDGRGFHGETTSDKLKQVTPGDLASINIAWEVHKIRNKIAHEGATFAFTQPEARRALSQFEVVFRDLEVIE